MSSSHTTVAEASRRWFNRWAAGYDRSVAQVWFRENRRLIMQAIEASLRDIARVLRPNGRVLILDLCRDNLVLAAIDPLQRRLQPALQRASRRRWRCAAIAYAPGLIACRSQSRGGSSCSRRLARRRTRITSNQMRSRMMATGPSTSARTPTRRGPRAIGLTPAPAPPPLPPFPRPRAAGFAYSL
jgi:hypothetical protein